MLGHEKAGLADRTASRTDLKLMRATVDVSLTTGQQAQAPSVHTQTCVLHSRNVTQRQSPSPTLICYDIFTEGQTYINVILESTNIYLMRTIQGLSEPHRVMPCHYAVIKVKAGYIRYCGQTSYVSLQ